MTREELMELVRSVEDPELPKEHGMVAQVWQDGEYTSQKAGDLLWQRTLHCIEPAIPGAAALGLVFPHAHGANSFAWVRVLDAYRVRDAIRELLGISNEGVDRMRDLYKRFEPEGR